MPRIASTCSSVPEVGLEPTHSCEYWILSPESENRKANKGKRLRKSSKALVPSVVPYEAKTGDDLAPVGLRIDAELRALIDAWPRLPEHVRQTIRTLIGLADG